MEIPGEKLVGKPWEIPWENHGNFHGNPWESSGYENHGKTHGKGPWEINMGKPWEFPWESRGRAAAVRTMGKTSVGNEHGKLVCGKPTCGKCL